MLIAGIDTSGRQGSVALVQERDGELVTLALSIISGGQYSELLVPTLAGLLTSHGYQRSSIDLIGVASGPGSFTGLRIAIATAKGLAEAFNTPVVDVSVLEAVALASGEEGDVIAAIDAQRTEVFYGEYTVTSANPIPAQMNREGIASFSRFSSLLSDREIVPRVYTSDESIATRLREAAFEVRMLDRPSAEAYARIAHRKFRAGNRADVATLDANYLRRSDAEIFAPPQRGTASK